MKKINVVDNETGVTFIFKSHKDKEAFFDLWDKLEIKAINSKSNKFEKGYEILAEYFDSISDEEKPKVDKQLKRLGL